MAEAALRYAAAALVLLLAAAGPARASDNLITTPGAAAAAVAEIAAAIGHEPSVSLIDIGPDNVTMQVQGEKPFHVNEWRWDLLKFWFIERGYVSGPQAVQPSAPVKDISRSFFPLSEVPLDRVPDIVTAAIERAALEDNAEIVRVRIERSVSIFPEPHFGEPRWTLSVTSGRENAVVYADLAGKIVGADVSGTQRARLLDMLAGDAYLAEAKADLAAALDPGTRLREVSFSKTGISARAEHPTKKDYTVSYYWNLSGVRHDPFDSPAFRRASEEEEQDLAFAFSDLDFAILPELKKQALDKLKMAGGAVSGIKAEKQVTGLRPPELVWIVDVEDANGERGQAIADLRGKILEVVEPESRRPKLDWLAGSTVRATLDHIFEKFPKDTKFGTILINDERGHVEVEDPLKPGEMATFIVDGTTITPFGRPIPPEMFGLGPQHLFTGEEMAGYDAATLDTLKERALERLKVKDGKVFRLTFERGNVFVASPRGNVLLEIRVDGPGGRDGGRVTYEPDGTELDVVLP